MPLGVRVAFLASTGSVEEASDDDVAPESACRKWLPSFGVLWTSRTPSFDDIERTIQMFALLFTLFLSFVFPVALTEDFNHSLDKRYKRNNLLISTLGSVLGLIFSIVVYIAFALTIHEGTQHEKTQLKVWWARGRFFVLFLFFVIISCIVMAILVLREVWTSTYSVLPWEWRIWDTGMYSGLAFGSLFIHWTFLPVFNLETARPDTASKSS